MSEVLLAYLAVGAASGILAGLLGVGGGLVIVPSLLYIFRRAGFDESLVLHLALGTSLAVIVFNALSSLRAHHKRGAVRWDLARQLTPSIVIGTLLGAALAEQMNTLWLQRLFGSFALLVGLQMLSAAKAQGRFNLPGMAGQTLAGGIVGVISALVGIGGGSMTVPYLTACRVSIREAVATSAACGLPIALAGTAGYLWIGWNNELLPALSSGYIHWPALVGIAISGMLLAPVGAHLAHTLPTAVLKRFFGVLLLVLGGRLILIA